MNSVEFDYKVSGRFLQITPKGGIQDNAQYELRIQAAKSTGGKVLKDFRHTVMTRLTPAYCSLHSVRNVVAALDFSDAEILFSIREASRHADYLLEGGTGSRPMFVVEQFVKTKVALECVLKACISRFQASGRKGALGKLSFEHTGDLGSVESVITYLEKELKKWEEAIQAASSAP